MAKWLGFIVVAKKKGAKRHERVCKPYETRAAADMFLQLYKSVHPDTDPYVTQLIKAEKA